MRVVPLLAVATLLVISGCATEPEPVPALDSTGAIAAYQGLYDDIEATMTSLDIGEPLLESQHALVPQGGDDPVCGFWIGRVSSERELDIADERAEEFAEALAPILEEHGFPPFERVVFDAGPGWPEYTSDLPDGTATVRLSLRGGVTASVFSTVTDDPCDD